MASKKRGGGRKDPLRWLVFISHSGADAWIAKQIAARIEECGARTFLDEAHIAVGEDFEERILRALDETSELFVLLTPWSVERPYVLAEMAAAWGRRLPIVGVLLGLSAEDDRIPPFMKKRDLIELNQVEIYFKELQQRLLRGEG